MASRFARIRRPAEAGVPMNYLAPASLLAAGLVALAAAAPYAARVTSTTRAFHLEVTARSDRATSLALRATAVGGDSSAGQPVSHDEMIPGTVPQLYHLPLAPGRYRELRLEAGVAAAQIRLVRARVMNRSAQVIRELPVPADGGRTFRLDPPLVLRPPWRAVLVPCALLAAGIFAVVAGLLAWLQHRAKVAVRHARPHARPQRVVLAVALLAAVASSYPVVFFGRSFVSPNFAYGTLLLYPKHPTLPGDPAWETEYEKTSDTAALILQHVPYARVQRDAWWHDGELPLWNRYNSGGTVLLAQGQSMWGNPLQFLVQLAGSTAAAWDALLVLMKASLAAGAGLITWQLTRHAGAAGLTAAIAPFLGFFIFRLNHPAIFSLGTAPWILWCWLRMVDARETRAAGRWLAALFLANWCEITSGTAKEAYMLLLGLNFTGALLLGTAVLPGAEKARRFALAAVAGGLFALAAAPLWLTFRDTLAHAYTMYNEPAVAQFPPGFALGLFDELLLRPLTAMRRVVGPAANFVVLLGVLYALATAGRADRRRLALLGGCLLPAALAFGVVPAAWIMRVPVLRNVAHIDNTFSCVLLVQLLPLAGCGFAAAARRLGTPVGRRDLLVAGVLLAGLVAAYAASVPHVLDRDGGPGRASPFVWEHLALLLAAAVALAFALRRLQSGRARTAAVPLVAALAMGVMLWRQGQHLATILPDYVFNPPPRVDLYRPSPALEWIRRNQDAPSRVAGLGLTLSPGWNDVYRLEGITGPDGVVNARYRELLRAAGLELVWDWRFLVSAESAPAQRRLLDFLNVEFLAGYGMDPATPPDGFQFVHQSDLEIFRSPGVWPRAFFTDALATYTTPASLADLIRAGDGRPFAAVQVGQPGAGGTEAGAPAGRVVVAASDYTLTNQTTSFTVTAPAPGYVVLQETWFDGDITARVDGRPVPCFRVNHAFRGVALPTAGPHRITFGYWPRHFTGRLVMSAGGWLGILVGLGLLRTRSRRGADPGDTGPGQISRNRVFSKPTD